MRRRPRHPCALLRVALLGLLGGATGGQASVFMQGPNFSHPAQTVESNEVWVAAETIRIAGHMEQAFFGLAHHAELDGSFAQDVWVAARQVSGRPHIQQNLRLAAAEQILFAGRAEGNLMAVSGDTIEVGSQARIGKNALLIAPTVRIAGHIGGDVRVIAATVIVSGRIDGDLDARPAHLAIADGGRVQGQIRQRYDPPVREEGSVLVGRPEPRPRDESAPRVRREWRAGGWLSQAYLYGAAVLGGLFFLALLPGYAGRSVRLVRCAFWKSLIAGAIWFVLIPLGILLISLTLIGLPAAVVLGLLYGILLYVSRMVVALAIGGILLRRRGLQSFGTAAAALVLGLLFLYLGLNIPMIGIWMMWVITLTGLGALLLGMRPHAEAVSAPPPLPFFDPTQNSTTPPFKSGD